ncbi:MAG: hypothetical protein MUC28_01160 [Planctomycetes bacterium]|jgi:hypothetical protein|nr:hypothetical protein [Planctomycetota bacterium]
MLKINDILTFLLNLSHNLSDNSRQLSGQTAVKIFSVFIILINFSTWLMAFYIDKLISGEQIALHYNVDFGINLMGSVKEIYIIPVLGLIVFLINLILLINISRGRERQFTTQVLMSASLLCNITLLASIGAVYLINFR